ncbi:MAG: hypothetical protein NTV01_12505 [Bacteroidia bacterium]|nr:hypothetical protein [Bacteroidia bacterium]
MISLSSYKNKKSIVLESPKMRAEFIPDPGGKLASLINKETGYEYLVQRKNPIYRDQPFGGLFVDAECSGFDDMFPTIDTCNYENEPWKGVEMADHGEVWSLPWEYSADKISLHLSVHGVRFSYKLEKTICFSNENSLRIDYTLKNYSPFDFEFLWAGHLMINLEEGTQLNVPEDCKQAVTVLTNGQRAFGDINNWPLFRDNIGNTHRADLSGPKSIGRFEKYYFNNRLKDGWCELRYPDNKNKLKVSFPVNMVPYLGILMNEGGWDGLYNIIIEPCTVCYDRPDVAKKYGQVSKIEALGIYRWHIGITI